MARFLKHIRIYIFFYLTLHTSNVQQENSYENVEVLLTVSETLHSFCPFCSFSFESVCNSIWRAGM